ncbi:MspA family porin [Rhodococcus qingshengii]|uniref:MspA family porin n=1 Tax=Rhodococcus qingshengii TaxID=334542 RepID=UPI00366099F8
MFLPDSSWDWAFRSSSLRVSISGVPPASLGVNASANPSIQSTFAPGTVTTTPLGTKGLGAATGCITAENVHVKVDACAGLITIRSCAQFAVSTANSNNTVFVYSSPTQFRPIVTEPDSSQRRCAKALAAKRSLIHVCRCLPGSDMTIVRANKIAAAAGFLLACTRTEHAPEAPETKAGKASPPRGRN